MPAIEVMRLSSPHLTRLALQRARKILHQGGVIVYPTDTAYALGGVFNRPIVTKKIRKIKRRRDSKFTVIATSLAQAKRYFRLPPLARKLARQYWPGPVSIIVNPKLAVRVPDSYVARTLARLAGAPLIATSANRSGGSTPYTVRSVLRQLRGPLYPDLILDGGRLPKRKPSTIVKVDGRGKLRIVRSGAASLPSVKRKALSEK